MPSVYPVDVRDNSHGREISREDYETVSGDESGRDMTDSEAMETDDTIDDEVKIVADYTGAGHQGREVEVVDEVINLTNDNEVEIVREIPTINLTGAGHPGMEVEVVDEVIDLTSDLDSEEKGAKCLGTDATTPDSSEDDMEVEEVHNNINLPQLILEDHLDETKLARVYEIINQDLKESALKEDQVYEKSQPGCSKWSNEWSPDDIANVIDVEVASALKLDESGEVKSMSVSNTVQPISVQPNTPNAPQTPQVEEVFNSFNELLNAPTPSSTMLNVNADGDTEKATLAKDPTLKSDPESESETESEDESEPELDQESEEDTGDQVSQSRSLKCRESFRTNITKDIEKILINKEQITQLEISFRVNFGFLAGTFGGTCNPAQIQTFMTAMKMKIFNKTEIGDTFKKRSQWNKAYELLLDSDINCQKRWIKALKKSSSFEGKALKVRQNKEEINSMQKCVEVQEAYLLGMQANYIEPNCTKFSKEASKEAYRESLKRKEESLLQVEGKEEIAFLLNGLADILKIQYNLLDHLKQELTEKTDRVIMFREHFDLNLNRLMS